MMRIGQLASAVGCSVDAIRFYEKRGLLPPPQRSQGNFRLYNDDHLQRLSFICYCRSLDISLNEIKTLIDSENASAQRAEEIDRLLDRHIKDIAKRIHELSHLRMKFIQLKEKSLVDKGEDPLQSLLQHSGIRFVRLK